MAEFTELPIAAGPLVPRVIYNELLNAINNRRTVVLPDATAAFTIHNTAGDATSATVEIDTGADEIYLIVVGGADASNTTLDLTAAAHDTITELVAVINALGFSWVAVETSGVQSAAAGNDSDTLLSLGPADCLGASHITWFTNYAPNGVIVGELYKHIAAYRAAIDALVNHFYTSGVSDTAYTANTLHNAAFGDNNWDPAGAPDLTPPCLPHENLWNDMKLCLDLLKWVKIDTDNAWIDGVEWFEGAHGPNVVWNVVRAAAFAAFGGGAWGLSPIVGRQGLDQRVAADYFVQWLGGRESLSDNFQTGFDFTAIPTPPSVTDGYLKLPWAGSVVGSFGVTSYTDIDIDITVAGQLLAGSSYTVVTAGTGTTRPQIDAAALAAITLDTVNNAILVEWASGAMNADPGAVEWPAPPLPQWPGWSQGLTLGFWIVYLKLSWD